MNNSKLIKLLRQISPREIQQFKTFVAADFVTSNVRLKNLINYIAEIAPDFESSRLSKRVVYKVIYDKEPYGEKKMNNLLSDLYQLLESFITWKALQKDPIQQKSLLAKELLEREVATYTEATLKKLRQEIGKKTEKSFESYGQQYELSELEDRHALSSGLRVYSKHLQIKSDAIDHYYWINKFRIACDMASRNRVAQAGYDCHFWPMLEKGYLENKHSFREHPVLKIYYLTYCMLTDLSVSAHYFELKALLEKSLSLFPTAELNNIYKYLLNYCVGKINVGEENYYKEVLDLYKVLLEKEILFLNGYLSQWTYINIITAGIRLKEYEWTEGFIYKYRKFLLPEERQNVFKYGLSSLFFEKQEYIKAITFLNDVAFTDGTYHLRTKILQLKSYFELEEEEAMLSLIEAFKKYNSRSKTIPDYQKRANNNFLKLTKLLYKLRLNKALIPKAAFKKKYQQVEIELLNREPLANKKWLKEQLWRIGNG